MAISATTKWEARIIALLGELDRDRTLSITEYVGVLDEVIELCQTRKDCARETQASEDEET